MTSQRRGTIDDGDDVGTTPNAWRFRWVERDIKDINAKLEPLEAKVDGLQKSMDKLNTNLKIAAAVIVALGAASRFFTADAIELFKRLFGIG